MNAVQEMLDFVETVAPSKDGIPEWVGKHKRSKTSSVVTLAGSSDNLNSKNPRRNRRTVSLNLKLQSKDKMKLEDIASPVTGFTPVPIEGLDGSNAGDTDGGKANKKNNESDTEINFMMHPEALPIVNPDLTNSKMINEYWNQAFPKLAFNDDQTLKMEKEQSINLCGLKARGSNVLSNDPRANDLPQTGAVLLCVLFVCVCVCL